MTITQIEASEQIKGIVPAGNLPPRHSCIPFVLDGEGAPPVPGSWGQISIPFACTVLGWTLTADQPGDAVIDIQRAAYADFPVVSSITGATPPTLASQQKNENLAVSGWTTAVNAGDILEFVLLSVTACIRLNLSINISIP